MTSKHSFSEGALLRDGLRRNLWCTVLSALGFLMTLLLPVLMLMQRALEQQRQIAEGLLDPHIDAAASWQAAVARIGSMLGGGNAVTKLAFMGLAVVCGVAAYSYLHSRQRVDFYHALPVSRTRQFANRFIVGILCVAPVYLIVLALTIGCTYAMGFGEAVRWGYIGGSILSVLIVFLLVYALSALAAILCGNTIISLLLLLWILFGPVAASFLRRGICNMFFDTYASSFLDSTRILRVAPVFQIFELDGLRYTSDELAAVQISAGALHAVYLAVAVLVTLLCLFLYRIRKSERAGMALAFTPLQAPLKLVMCLMAGTAFGLLFETLSGGFWFWPGLIIGAVLFHFLVEIIYAFDFHAIFRKPAHLVLILALLIGGGLLLRADVFGYDRYLPEENKIMAVDLDAIAVPVLQTPENIRAVRRIAEMGIEAVASGSAAEHAEQAAYDDGTGPRYDYVSIAYRLTNGRIVSRAYTMPESEELKALQRQIMSSEEYKRCKWTLFTFNPKGDTSQGNAAIEVVNELGYESQGIIFEQGEVQQVLDTLREEALTRPDTAVPALRLNLGYQRKMNTGESYLSERGGAIVTRADTKTLALIEQLTGVTPQSLTPDEIRAIEITPLNEETWAADVTDATDIAQLLKDAVNCDVFRLYGEEAYENAFDKQAGVRVTAISKHGANSYALYYPLGKTPTALIEKYSAPARAAQPAQASAKSGVIVADAALPW